ncbi:hypothetical protein [Streptomyces sp. NPDC093544]|uniref:hypothetical protein n=1 Tax=Streptomyces sp. NPDC093544 TaxID=3155200 RepID=UPI00342FEDD7
MISKVTAVSGPFADVSSRKEGVLQATRIALGLLAHRIGQLSEQIRNVDARLTRLVKCHAPQLLDVVGVTKPSAVKARTQAGIQFKSVLITADPALREELAQLGNAELFRTCARLSLIGVGVPHQCLP